MTTNRNQAFALLLIDMQRDFWPDDIAADFPELGERTQRLREFCAAEGIEVIHLQAVFSPDGSDWMPRYRLLGRVPCVRGSGGEAVLPWAEPRPGEKVIEKQVFDGFHTPQLLPYLRERGKRFLLTAGIETSVCVLSTTLSAMQLGFLAAVVSDCCADWPAKHAHVLSSYPFAFDTVTTEELAEALPRWRQQTRDSDPDSALDSGQ